MAEQTIQTLGHYTIRAELGRGGFATVYHALDTSLEREVALKILHPQLLADRSFAERFRKEARALAALRHPHIVTVYEVGEAEGRLYIAMELAKGSSLAQAIAERGRILWNEAVALLKPVCEALDYAHAQGIVHRDLKPANILLDKERGALLTDFGFARLMGESSMSISLSGGVMGTPAYIAPEVWESEAAKPAADVYALGCIVFEMLTGQVLFAGKTPMQAMRAHDKGPQLPSAWPEGVPAGVEAVLGQALAHQPDARYPSASALWQALNDLEVDTQAQREKAERAAVAAQWKAEAEAVFAAGEWSAARMAVGRWLAITPDDQAALALRQEIDQCESEARAKAEAEQRAQREAEERQRREAERKAAQEAEQKAREGQARKVREEQAEREREAERLRQTRSAQAAAEQKARQEREQQMHTQQPPPTPAARRTIPAWVWIGGVVALLACVVWVLPRMLLAPAATPLPTAPAWTRAPTKPPEPTKPPAQPAQPTQASTAMVKPATPTPIVIHHQFLDTFDSNTNQWDMGDFSDDYATGNTSLSNGKYRWTILALKGVNWYSGRVDTIALSDFQLTLEGQMISGPQTAGYGVYFRGDGTNGYFFLIQDGRQAFYFARYEGAWVQLINLTKTDAIKPGAVNQLTVLAKGSHFVFYINGVQVGATDDDQLSGGQAGISVELPAGDAAVFDFDNFRVGEP